MLEGHVNVCIAPCSLPRVDLEEGLASGRIADAGARLVWEAGWICHGQRRGPGQGWQAARIDPTSPWLFQGTERSRRGWEWKTRQPKPPDGGPWLEVEAALGGREHGFLYRPWEVVLGIVLAGVGLFWRCGSG